MPASEAPLSPELVATLEKITTATITTMLLKKGIRRCWMSGPMPFSGDTKKRIVGPAFTRLMPVSVLFGACYLLAVDTVARTLGTVELPLGVLTAALGTPVFLWLLAFSRRPAWS